MNKRRGTFFAGVFYFLIFSGVVGLFLSCSRSGEEEIIDVMERRERAFNWKQLKEYMKVFSKDYRDKKGGIESLERRMERNFRLLKSIKFSNENRKIFIKGNAAEVTQDFTMEYYVGNKKHIVKDREKFELKKEASRWLIFTMGSS